MSDDMNNEALQALDHLRKQIELAMKTERALGALNLTAHGLGLALQGLQDAMGVDSDLAPELGASADGIIEAGEAVQRCIGFIEARQAALDESA